MNKLYILILFVILFYACTENSPTISTTDTFKYIGYDSIGNIINYGTLTIEQDTTSIIKGRWHFVSASNNDEFGPQFGMGNCIGGFNSENELWLNLNPEFADNNVFLIGEVSGDNYTGRWDYSTFIGSTNYGTFTARK